MKVFRECMRVLHWLESEYEIIENRRESIDYQKSLIVVPFDDCKRRKVGWKKIEQFICNEADKFNFLIEKNGRKKTKKSSRP